MNAVYDCRANARPLRTSVSGLPLHPTTCSLFFSYRFRVRVRPSLRPSVFFQYPISSLTASDQACLFSGLISRKSIGSSREINPGLQKNKHGRCFGRYSSHRPIAKNPPVTHLRILIRFTATLNCLTSKNLGPTSDQPSRPCS